MVAGGRLLVSGHWSLVSTTHHRDQQGRLPDDSEAVLPSPTSSHRRAWRDHDRAAKAAALDPWSSTPLFLALLDRTGIESDWRRRGRRIAIGLEGSNDHQCSTNDPHRETPPRLSQSSHSHLRGISTEVRHYERCSILLLRSDLDGPHLRQHGRQTAASGRRVFQGECRSGTTFLSELRTIQGVQ